MTQDDTTQLLQLARQGNHYAATRLIERFRRLATTTAQLALRNTDDAQDVAQEALIYALLHLHQCRDDAKFGPWLRQITFSLCADYRRRRGTRRLGEPLTVLNEAAEEAHLAERLALQKSLATLSEAHRTTVLLHYVGGWSLEETAALLAVPVNTVRSRLMAAKAKLRVDLDSLISQRKPNMSTQTTTLTPTHTELLYAAFLGAKIVSLEESPEPWMPFKFRITLETSTGEALIVDLRDDINPDQAAQLPALQRAGIPGPNLLGGPVPDGHGGHWSLCTAAAGKNLLLWALGGTPHRIRIATERTFEAIERLQSATPALEADPAFARLPRRTLSDEAEALVATGGPWLSDPWFLDALTRTRASAKEINDPLVYTHYLHFFPNFVRIHPETDVNRPLGWPGDARLQVNPIAELVNPFGYFGDPLLGLAMVWIYDCYPVVHTGFVEQYLWRHGKTQKDFAPRLAINALRILQRETRPEDTGEYPTALRAWAEQALNWM
ncbi:MAG: RNA polymerase sigma factor [Armatimonas sp.]